MKRQRNIIRIIHLVGAAAIGTFVYAPVGQVAWFVLLMQAIIIPLLTLTGLWLWKPKWFRLKSSKALLALGAVATLGLTAPNVQAQQARQQVGTTQNMPENTRVLKGGAGHFYVGYKGFDAASLSYFLPDAAPALENGLWQMGGQGYFVLNRFLLGGGGHYTGRNQFSFANNRYALNGGGGYVTLGYNVVQQQGLLLFPYTNVGVEALGLNIWVEEDVAFAQGQFTQASYSIVTPTVDVGIGADWWPWRRGLKVGARVGFQYALNRSPQWHHAPGQELTNANAPATALDGFYVRLVLGGGYLAPGR